MEAEFDLNKLEKPEKIGEGHFFIVYKAIDKDTNTIYAAKQLKIDDNHNPAIDVLQSYQIISKLNYPSITKCFGYSPKDFENSPNPIIITEYFPNGSLKNMLDLERKGMAPIQWNPTQKLKVIYGISSGMSYLHLHNIVHMDLSGDNILLDESLNPKISGFGIANYSDHDYGNQIVGTFRYVSPDFIKGKEFAPKRDVYAFSMLLYEILSGQIPFENLTRFQIINSAFRSGERPNLPDSFSKPCRDLIEQCWSEDPDERPPFDEILQILKKDPKSFINDEIDENDYFNYVRLLEQDLIK